MRRGFLLALLVLLAGCGAPSIMPTVIPAPVATPTPPPTAEPTVGVYQVRYTVTGSTNAVMLTYANATGATEQKKQSNKGAMFDARPWMLSFMAPVGQVLYIIVQNSDDHGSVSCEISVNGRVIQKAQSEGGYTVATCSGVVEP